MSAPPQCLKCGSFISHGPVLCSECLIDHDNQMREEGAKAERERVLKIVDQIRETAISMLSPPTGTLSSQDRFRKNCMDDIDLMIKSLRSPGQKQERDPE